MYRKQGRKQTLHVSVQLEVPFDFPSKTAILGKKAFGQCAAKTVCVTSLVRINHSKDGILK